MGKIFFDRTDWNIWVIFFPLYLRTPMIKWKMVKFKQQTKENKLAFLEKLFWNRTKNIHRIIQSLSKGLQYLGKKICVKIESIYTKILICFQWLRWQPDRRPPSQSIPGRSESPPPRSWPCPSSDPWYLSLHLR